MPCTTVWKRAQRVRRRETISDCGKQPDNRDLETLQARLISSTSASSLLVLRAFCLSACCHCGVEVWCSDTMLLLISLLLMGLDCLLGAPTGREVYRMPQSALKGNFSKLIQVFNYGNIRRWVAVCDYTLEIRLLHLKYECSLEVELTNKNLLREIYSTSKFVIGQSFLYLFHVHHNKKPAN